MAERKTVRMKKGELYADIFDSPETIATAVAEGYEMVEEKKAAERPVQTKTHKGRK